MEDLVQGVIYIVLGAIALTGAAKVIRHLFDGEPRRVACLGDSLTADGGYCRELRRRLPEGSVVRIFGYGGAQSSTIRHHLPEVLAWRPSDVVVLAGVNDLPAIGGAGVAATNLSKIYDAVRSKGIRVVAVQITPWHGYSSAANREQNTFTLNDWIAYEAAVDEVVPTDSLGDYNYELLSKYDSGDGLHLNSAGQRALGALIAARGFRR
jgi:lysophospholipase L1-like esterase